MIVDVHRAIGKNATQHRANYSVPAARRGLSTLRKLDQNDPATPHETVDAFEGVTNRERPSLNLRARRLGFSLTVN